MNFISLDFETANRYRSSACSIAIVMVRNDQIVDNFYSLINPQEEFDYRNIQVHGIHPEDVADAPTFDQVWQHIYPLFDEQHLVAAHNSRFDVSVLNAALNAYQIKSPHFQVIDTLKTSRTFYPGLPNHKLNTVSENLGVDLKNHHNALADSVACAQILLKTVNDVGIDSVKPLVKMS